MFAVITTGGKQYKVAPGDEIRVETIAGAPGESISFDEVLMVGGDGGETSLAAGAIDGASVAAEIVGQVRAKKVIAFKKRRRKNSRRKRGHRQNLTLVRIGEFHGVGARGGSGGGGGSSDGGASVSPPAAAAGDGSDGGGAAIGEEA
jgi:large subunit ribosomal protein L21